MLNALVIRLGLKRDDDDVKIGGQGRRGEDCHGAFQFIARLQGETDRKESNFHKY